MPQQTRYCNAPLDYPLAQRPSPVGEDKGAGVIVATASGLELRQLQVTIRHGDRSAIHELPNANEKMWKCQPFSEDIRRKWKDVSRYGTGGKLSWFCYVVARARDRGSGLRLMCCHKSAKYGRRADELASIRVEIILAVWLARVLALRCYVFACHGLGRSAEIELQLRLATGIGASTVSNDTPVESTGLYATVRRYLLVSGLCSSCWSGLRVTYLAALLDAVVALHLSLLVLCVCRGCQLLRFHSDQS